ncbi:MAG: hypothetical protein DRJ42_19145 [Deltaproteobacteria bacterium]|nr:MAG: hypothetical protein DRJ42_19145 [Deltaproteobacteria bacterium]
MMMKKLPLLVLCLGLVGSGLLGCGEVTAGAPAELELGTGSWRFEALDDGQEVELIRGAQGGWHMWISLRVRGVDMERPPVRLRMQLADESRPAQDVEVAVRFDDPDDEGWRKLIGYTGIVNDPACLVGELFRIEASLPMGGDEVMRAERDVTLLGGAYPPPACE